ncbi:hypothetical protein [Pantoea sp. Z09]|uniref:hypothetical protein n=1 Tax=Pantoea sp. Z09 TaxID=2886821 RepID=UPI001EFD2F08|nr:hypothetical protein [Pantoea sp. Z09]
MIISNYLASERYLFFLFSVSGYKRISSFWDFKKGTCEVDSLIASINTFAENEKIMARFFLSIWFGENYGFDLIRDIAFLLPDDIGIINDWNLEPYIFRRN